MTAIASLTNQAVRPLQLNHAFSPSTSKLTNGVGTIDGTDDLEEYTIKCVCGYDDDDGNTVECEQCLTWQHIACYYPSYPERPLPDQHKCCDCDPSTSLDRKKANDRQRLKRIQEAHQFVDRKVKRPGAKSHKKKPKDASAANYSNGWSLQDRHDSVHGRDRKSGSPRDQPPPAKKPKISHRASGSIHASAGGLPTPSARKRNASVCHTRESPGRMNHSLDSYALPENFFSSEFIFLHRNNSQFVEAQANFYLDIDVTNDLTRWLDDPEALAEATNGKAPRDIYQRWPEPIEEIPKPQIVKVVHEDRDVKFHGHHPSWHCLTVPSGVAEGGFVGELKGRVGRLEDYKADPANRWQTLRHPEPFVFFHPQLPIYIDARCEGNMLRYVRRSCRPNLEMKTIITEGRNYRFCFVAKEEIPQNQEITVGWNVEAILLSLDRLHTRSLGQLEREDVYGWVEGVLANFGGCACGQAETTCWLAPLDHRAHASPPPTDEQDMKEFKGKKRRKLRDPSLTVGHVANDNRTGSDIPAPGLAQEEDNEDSPSQSGSAQSKPTSRDITPMTHVSGEGINGASSGHPDREARKIMLENRLFSKLEQGKSVQKKKKRNSGGSTVNTPSADASKKQLDQLTISDLVLHTPAVLSKSRNFDFGAEHARPGSPNDCTSIYRRQSGNKQDDSKGTKAAARRPRDVGVDMSIQTDPEVDDIPQCTSSPPRRKPFVPLKQKLLRRCLENHSMYNHRERQGSEAKSTSSPTLEMPPPPAPLRLSSSSTAPSSSPPAVKPLPDDSGDIEMRDRNDEVAEPVKRLSPSEHGQSVASILPSTDDPPQGSHPPIKHPPPPWPSSPPLPDKHPPSKNLRSPNLRVQLPPAPHFSNHSPASPFVARTPGSATGAIVQSPFSMASQPPNFPPTVASAATPSPAKKKLSLSDYTKRKKVETPAIERDKFVMNGFPIAMSPLVKSESSLAEEQEDGSRGSAPGETARIKSVHSQQQ